MRSKRQGSKSSLLAFVTLSAFVLTLCAVGAARHVAAQGQGTTVTVTITTSNPPTVSPDPAEISKSNGDQVEWVCPQCTNGFAVHFPQGTPFADSSFDQSHASSGRAQSNAQAGTTYHYTVTVGGNSADPGVKLNP
jgi:plastocyanin